MGNIPGTQYKDESTEPQYRFLMTLIYTSIILFGILIVLTSMNIWQILIK